MANGTNETTLPGAISDPLGIDRDEAFELDRSGLSGDARLSGARSTELGETEVIPLVEETPARRRSTDGHHG